ncbi:MAG TPA: protein kinase family protein, partial [Candidatus Jeotgalibaca merdavium]|nr:protein kinase family protein [Candidatus Jeotgalibaca merdavium]
FKGYFNDPSLIVDGFHTYDMVHETYALTRIVIFVMTGKTNLNNIDDEDIKSLIQKGLCPEKEERFQSVEELTHFFNSISFNNLE